MGVRGRKVVRWGLARWVNSVDRDVVGEDETETVRWCAPEGTSWSGQPGGVHGSGVHIRGSGCEAMLLECCLEVNAAAAAAAVAAATAAAVESMGTPLWS